MDLGKTIKKAIVDKGWKLKDIAEKMQVRENTVSEWCNNKKTQKWYDFLELIKHLDLVEHLFPGYVKKEELIKMVTFVHPREKAR